MEKMVSGRFSAPGGRRASRLLARGSSISLIIISVVLSQNVAAFLEQTTAKTTSNSSSPQSVWGNMSAMMTNQQVPAMTNSSIINSLATAPMAIVNRTVEMAANSSKTAPKAVHMNPQVSPTKTNNRPAPTNSPAFNSRQIKQTGAAGRRHDNQMAADDTHGAQTFMTISSAATSVGTTSEVDRAGGRAKATEPSEHVSKKGAQSPADPAPRASPAASGGPSPWASSSGQPQWRPRAGGLKTSTQQQVAQYLEPPAPVQQRYQHEQSDSDGPMAQLERPAGYSYDSPGGYTHTSPLSPARQEVQQAEQVSYKQRHAHHHQQSPSPPFYYERSPHSASIFDSSPRAEQVAIGGKPAFTQQVLDPLYAGRAQGPPRAPGAHAPHHTVTGTAGSPCRPANPDLSQNSIQVIGGDAGAAAQALPNFSASGKYQRLGAGTRLRSQYVFKVLRADSLTDCELACSKASALANNPADACRSFNYRAYFAAENCELSRLDSRALKLEDSAQFEQHTQFDFYALPEQSAPLVYSPLFGEADCLDVSQSCSQDGMEFTLRTSEPFNGRIYTYGFYDSCFTDGEGARESGLRISRSNGFPRCGTQQIGDLMTNIVVVQFNDYVQTTRDKKYNLTCYFSGPAEAVVTSNYLDAKLDERSQPMQIEHLPPQNVITSNVHLRVLYRGQPTNTIAVGDLLTFRLESRGTGAQAQQRSGEPAAEIFATNVLAKDPYSGRQVQLIDARGCPLDPVNVFPELQRTPDGALESEFYAFKIPDSNFLIFQATVRTCKAPCEPVICQSSGPPARPAPAGVKGYLQQAPSSAPSWGRRRRREALFDDDEVAAGESVEHVIPARMAGARWPADARQVQSFRRPELSEAEEEVKDMFRVYLSRAEINRQQRATRPAPDNSSWAPLMSRDDEEELAGNGQSAAPEEVCVSQVAYYVLLLAVIVLSMLMLTLLCASLYIGRQAKVRISDSLSDAMF